MATLLFAPAFGQFDGGHVTKITKEHTTLLIEKYDSIDSVLNCNPRTYYPITKMGGRFQGSIPKGWLGCPENGNSLIAGKFMTLKTPLSSKYRNKMHPDDEYPPQEIFVRAKYNNVKIGLWIDLTNTDRYYDKFDIEYEGCRYVKLNCLGHGSCPPDRDIRRFISLVHNFILEYPSECIAVHCTHGFNRTGFLIVSYLVEKLNFDVGEAVRAFAISRPPGIYRENYITELFRRYGNVSQAPRPPTKPSWAH